MSAYVYPNFKTKKALKDRINFERRRGGPFTVVCKENEPGRQTLIENGEAFVEGPHYPEPHRWYAKVECEHGRVVKVVD